MSQKTQLPKKRRQLTTVPAQMPDHLTLQRNKTEISASSSNSSKQKFVRAAQVVRAVSRMLNTGRPSSLSVATTSLFPESARSLASEAPDPRTIRFIYSKAVNHAIEDYTSFVNRIKAVPSKRYKGIELPCLVGKKRVVTALGQQAVPATQVKSIAEYNRSPQYSFSPSSIYIDKLPEIYESMLFMGQTPGQRKRQRHRHTTRPSRTRRKPSQQMLVPPIEITPSINRNTKQSGTLVNRTATNLPLIHNPMKKKY